MEPASAVLGIIVALPQAIQAAKELYDLRARFKDASVLITAIYSESMVIAASLSQVQNLLHHDALQSKPQLLHTFDRALTGCRVVYGCLEEEVRDLVAKTEADDLKFRDRAKFLWKEDTFKELLTQIRGQQSALSLLIQGLQMESIADIRKLVEENSVTLDQVVTRSKTLRISHPRVQVPESLFSHVQEVGDVVDVDSIAMSTEFAFDDEVINSKAYRRATHLYTSNTKPNTGEKDATQNKRDHPPAYEPVTKEVECEKTASLLDNLAIAAESSDTKTISESIKLKTSDQTQLPVTRHRDDFGSLSRNCLPHMSHTTSTAPPLGSLRANTSVELAVQTTRAHARTPVRHSSEGDILSIAEAVPPLPRRPSGPGMLSEVTILATSSTTTPSRDLSINTSFASSVLSNNSATSSRTAYEPLDQRYVVSRKPLRKPLPLSHKVSRDILNIVRSPSSPFDSPTSISPLHNAQMHDIWLSLVDAEQKFVDRMSKLKKTFHDNVVRRWPALEQHLGALILGEQLAALNKEILLQVLEEQVSESTDAICDPTLFEHWVNQAHKIYREFCRRMPHTASALRRTQNFDAKFRPFVNTLGLSLAYFGMDWEDYLKLPMSQLDLYIDRLQSLIRVVEELDEPAAYNEVSRLKRAVAAVQRLKATSSTVLHHAEEREDTRSLERRIYTMDSDMISQLRLLDSSRRVKHQGGMAIKIKSQGPWQAVHVMLLDNYLLWGKVKRQKLQKKGMGDRILILEPPIAADDLDFTTPCEEHQSRKTTLFDEIPRGSVLYIITVKSKTTDAASHMLGAFSLQEREAWIEHFTAATMPQTRM